MPSEGRPEQRGGIAGGPPPRPQRFRAWQEKFENNLSDMGGKLGAGTLVTEDSAPDGPLIEVKELVGGYMIVTAESLDEASEVARECPGLVGPGSGVEVIEIHGP